jgi:light-independent protochlorophyllide reductase subunit B
VVVGSVDSTYLTGKRVFVFGDATHAIAMARVAREEIGFEVVGLGCLQPRVRPPGARGGAQAYGLEALITDDYLEVEAAIAEAQPELILGTQMERHIGKRLGIPCAVISAPVHVQDFPARYSPVMGFEGANVLFDTLVHPLVMGLEEHLLTMFREDFEFHDAAARPEPQRPRAPDAPVPAASRLASGPRPDAGPCAADAPPAPPPSHRAVTPRPRSGTDAERELRKIPFFVRGKARRNTEAFAADRGVAAIARDPLRREGPLCPLRRGDAPDARHDRHPRRPSGGAGGAR